MAQRRAKIGGEVGTNGIFYHGGEFLPSTTLLPLGKTARKPATGKREIEPYKWEVQPYPEARSVYRAFAGLVGCVRDGVAILRTDDQLPQSLAYLQMTLAEAQDLIDRYNAGQRWM